MEIRIIDKRMAPPTHATNGSAAVDLRASIPDRIYLRPGEMKDIWFGIAVDPLSPLYAGLIMPRSGLGSRGLVLQNCVGLIDSDYQGELKGVFVNRSVTNETFVIDPLDRIAQLVFFALKPTTPWTVVETFSRTTARGAGGYGSTGVKSHG